MIPNSIPRRLLVHGRLKNFADKAKNDAVFTVGECVGYCGGDIRRLADDIKSLQPTVLPKIQEGLGGRVRLMLTGSAPCADNALTFMRCALGAVIIEGYGQTECVACATITLEGDCVPGHVGVPSPCNAVKLVVPELGYFAKNNAGE
uniref:AMP-dependent synthetase/ligase domain-containing protein n=1 Tax=Panagrolaimus sp. JU765 TaxID=591449 RepID=A0AC34Q1H0_9BILA